MHFLRLHQSENDHPPQSFESIHFLVQFTINAFRFIILFLFTLLAHPIIFMSSTCVQQLGTPGGDVIFSEQTVQATIAVASNRTSVDDISYVSLYRILYAFGAQKCLP